MNRYSAIDRLFLEVAERKRLITSAELGAVLQPVSRAGFYPNADDAGDEKADRS